MDKSEPSLAPEWLRNSGNASGSRGSSNHFASSQSDGPLLALPKRNKSSKSIDNSDSLQSSFSDRNPPSNSRKNSSSNGSAKHDKNQYNRSYSSFTRSRRDRGRDRSTIDEHWDAEYSDPLRSIMTRRIEKDVLRRTQSMVSRQQSEVVQRRVCLDSRGTGYNNHEKGNDMLSAGSMEKVAFERDFPSLGSEDRPVTPDIGRVPSPGLSKTMQGLSMGSSSLVGGEGWTSALAEVPVGVGGNAVAPTLLQPAVVSSVSTASSTTNGLNMAEALVQAPLRSQTDVQPSMQNQKREELAVLQSMRLIPLTISMPKNPPNSSDKLKPKTPRSGEQVTASKNGHQLPISQLGGQSLRSANVANGPKASHTGKLLVLKAGRDNGISLASKDICSPTGSVITEFTNGQGAVGSLTGSSVVLKNTGSAKLSASNKTSASVLGPCSSVDKKPSLAHAKSRSDFFNMVRKNSMSNSCVKADSIPVVSSAVEKLNEINEGSSGPASPAEKDGDMKCNGSMSHGDKNFDNNFGDIAAIIPEEEEAKFLRSLGWVENDGDDEGLTEEEINAFIKEYTKVRPSSKLCRALQSKVMGQAEPQGAWSGGASTELSTSDSSA